MEINKKLLLLCTILIFVVATLSYFYKRNSSYDGINNSTENNYLYSDITEPLILDFADKFLPNRILDEFYTRYSTVIQVKNEKEIWGIFIGEDPEYKGEVEVSVNLFKFNRNNLSDRFDMSRKGGINTIKSYEEVLDFVKHNNVFDYTDKQLSDIFGSATLESGYYLGQPMNDIKAGLPAIVWREWSPNFQNLVYVYKDIKFKKDFDAKSTSEKLFDLDVRNYNYENWSLLIENGENDIDVYNAVPFGYMPSFPYTQFDPIFWINDNEFLYVTQPNQVFSGNVNLVSNALNEMSSDERSSIKPGLYAYNIVSGTSRLVDEYDLTAGQYKFITATSEKDGKEYFYVYGGSLTNVKQYDSNGNFIRNIEFEDKKQSLGFVIFLNWGTDVSTGENVALFDNIGSGKQDTLSIPLDW